jgi:hypothetical protein
MMVTRRRRRDERIKYRFGTMNRRGERRERETRKTCMFLKSSQD